MKKQALTRGALIAGTITGVLYATSYPPFVAWALFFAFAPLWIFWRRAKTLSEVALSGFAASFVMTLIGFNWIAHTATEYGHLPFIVSILILIGFCLFASLNVMLAGCVAWLIDRKFRLSNTGFFICVAILSAAFDWWYPTIFPWNAGYPLFFSKFKTAQLAQYFGFSFLGLVVYLANSLFAISFCKRPKRGWSMPLVIFIVGLLLLESWGRHVGNQAAMRMAPEKNPDVATFSALLVQPNIGNWDKFFAERGNGYQEPIVEKMFALTGEGLATQTHTSLQTPSVPVPMQSQTSSSPDTPDLIIWPETAYPASLDPFLSGSFYAYKLKQFIDSKKIPLITGAYSEDLPKRGQRPLSYNAVFLIQPQKAFQPGYRKNILLAFGEYFPGAQYFPFLKTWVPEISDFARGSGPGLFSLPKATLTPLICYEGLDADYARRAVARGGDIIINVTNDSWFGNYFEPRQHLIMTAARALEFRRPLIRVTNTGISTAIDASGHFLVWGPQNQEWTKKITLSYEKNPSNTLYFYIEPWTSAIFLGMIALVLVLDRLFKNLKRS